MRLRHFPDLKPEKPLGVETFWGQVETVGLRHLKPPPEQAFERNVSTSQPKKEIIFKLFFCIYMGPRSFGKEVESLRR